eukprot:scaffold45_cov337-Pavlova_lutheri.AAC.15
MGEAIGRGKQTQCKKRGMAMEEKWRCGHLEATTGCSESRRSARIVACLRARRTAMARSQMWEQEGHVASVCTNWKRGMMVAKATAIEKPFVRT